MTSTRLIEGRQPPAQVLQPLHVDVIADLALDVIERQLAHLPFDPDTVEGHRAFGAAERGHDPGDGRVVQAHPRHLGEDRLLPHLIAEAGLRTPLLAWIGVELAMATISEGAVAADAPAADALQQPREQVGAAPVMGAPPRVFMRRTRSTVAHSSSGTGGCVRQGAGRRSSSRPRWRRIQPLAERVALPALGAQQGCLDGSTKAPAVSLERFASGDAIRARYEALSGGVADGAADVFGLAADRDPAAAVVIRSAGQALAEGLVTLVWLLDPGGIVIGGGVAMSGGPWR